MVGAYLELFFLVTLFHLPPNFTFQSNTTQSASSADSWLQGNLKRLLEGVMEEDAKETPHTYWILKTKRIKRFKLKCE